MGDPFVLVRARRAAVEGAGPNQAPSRAEYRRGKACMPVWACWVYNTVTLDVTANDCYAAP